MGALDFVMGLQTDIEGVRLIRSTRSAGGDLRIRDIVYLLNPDSYQTLDPTQEVGIVGELDDGEPDTVRHPWKQDRVVADLDPFVDRIAQSVCNELGVDPLEHSFQDHDVPKGIVGFGIYFKSQVVP
jgi:hypothetical protein